jgi:hypothetical protein
MLCCAVPDAALCDIDHEPFSFSLFNIFVSLVGRSRHGYP